MSISATSATQPASAFVPEGVWLSGKLGNNSFVSRGDVYGRAPAGHSPYRRRDARPRYVNRPPTPATSPGRFPVTPPLSFPSLEAAHGLPRPKHIKNKNASAIRNNAYSGDVVGLQGTLPLRLPQNRYCAGNRNDYVPAVPKMGPLYHPPAINIEFPPQNGPQGSEVSTFSQSNTSFPSVPAHQRAAFATHELWKLMPMELERSIALLYRPEDLLVAGPHNIKTSKPLLKPKPRGVLSRLRHKLLRTQS